MSERVGGIYYDVTLDTSKMVDGSRRAQRELDGLSTKLTAAAAAVAVMAAALAAIKLAKMADEFRMLGARVDVAAGSIESGAAAMSSLVDISRRTQTRLAGVGDVFNRLNQSILQMGGTQQDTLRLTESLAKAIKVSGASAVEAKTAMLQFGQALGSGKLAGDELRSLLENAPYLMRQLADGIGVPIGSLKKLGEEGKLTADVVTAALTKAAQRIDDDFKKFPQTIESAMVVAQDAAAMAALKFDELSGTSATLTGVTKGLGEVFDKLADQLGAANTEAGKLGRNEAIKSWSDATRTALSYVIDAADLTWQTLSVLGRNVAFVFKGLGTEIGGIGAQIASVMRGDFAGAAEIGEAMKRDADQRRRELDAKDAEALRDRKLAGQQMREAWEQGAGGGRGFVNPTAEPSKLKSTGGKPKGDKFDSEKYLADLQAKTLDGIAKIDSMEQEALRRNAELLKAGKVTRAEAAKAATMIEEAAAQDRLDIQLRNAEAIRSAIEEGGKQEIEAKRKIDEEKKRAGSFAAGIAAEGDPAEQVRMQAAARLATLQEMRAAELLTEQQFSAAVIANAEMTQQRLAAIAQQRVDNERATQMMTLSMVSTASGQLLDVLKRAGKEHSALAKAAFLAQKAIAVAEIIMNTEVGAAKAIGMAGPFGIPLAAFIRAAGYTSAGLVAGLAVSEVAGGRQYGGPVSSDSLYRVNEGGRPEMFTAANGAQYMMPTTNGNVTPAGQVGAGANITVIIENRGTPQRVESQSFDQAEGMLRLVTADLVDQFSNNRGPVYTALSNSTNLQGRI